MVKVGGDIDSWCTKCKLILAHTVEAIVEDKIKRVHCNTCNSKHVYRAHEPGTVSKSSGATSSRQRASLQKKIGVAGMVRASDFDALMSGRNPDDAKLYSLKERFDSGQLLSHSNFGLGVVTANKGANKIEVLFNEGPKLLVHGRC